MNYNEFLLTQLLAVNLTEWRDMPYDEQYDTIGELYKEFQVSEYYNDLSLSEHDAMLEWIKIKFNK